METKSVESEKTVESKREVLARRFEESLSKFTIVFDYACVYLKDRRPGPIIGKNVSEIELW